MAVVLLLFYDNGSFFSVEVVLLLFCDSGPVAVLLQWSCFLFYGNGPVVVLWQWVCCFSMAVTLLSFYGCDPAVVL